MRRLKGSVGIFCLTLLLSINLASSAESSGLLSRLYNKAAQKNQPLILVLDNSNNPDARDGRSNRLQSAEHEYDSNDKFIYLNHYLQHAEKKDTQDKRTKSARDEFDNYKYRSNNRIPVRNVRDRHSLKDRSDRDRQGRLNRLSPRDRYDERDRREEKDRRDDPRLDRINSKNRYNERDRREERDRRDDSWLDRISSRDRYSERDRREERDRRDDPRLGRISPRDRYDEKDRREERDRRDEYDRWERNELMRSPILQNILKLSDQLLRKGDCNGNNDECGREDYKENNCNGANDECASPEKNDSCNGGGNNSFGGDEDEIRSTKGEIYVTEKNKCPRC